MVKSTHVHLYLCFILFSLSKSISPPPSSSSLTLTYTLILIKDDGKEKRWIISSRRPTRFQQRGEIIRSQGVKSGKNLRIWVDDCETIIKSKGTIFLALPQSFRLANLSIVPIRSWWWVNIHFFTSAADFGIQGFVQKFTAISQTAASSSTSKNSIEC